MSSDVLAVDPGAPKGLGAVLLAVMGVGAVAAVLAARPAGKSAGRTLLILVLGVPAAYGLGVLSRGAGDLRWPLTIAVAAAGACLAVALCSGGREEVRR